MKSVAALVLSLGCWLGSSACYQDAEDPLISSASSASSALELELEAERPVVCVPIPNFGISVVGSGGAISHAFSNAVSWLIDVPCGITNIDLLRGRLGVCLAGGNCGNPVAFSSVYSLMLPFLQGQGTLARVGAIPVELIRSGGRIRVLFDRRHDPTIVLTALRTSGQPPGPCPPLGCFKGGQAPQGAVEWVDHLLSQMPGEEISVGSVSSNDEDQSVAGLQSLTEVISAFPCCPGCGPCSVGQCEPRPVASPRVTVVSEFGCSPCDVTCRDETLSPSCPCLQGCIQRGECDL
jgi:hypothetical protein